MSKFEDEVNEVMSKGKLFEFPDITFTLHSPTGDYFVEQPLFVDVSDDYNKSNSSLITLQFIMSLGKYREFVVGNRDSLEVTVNFNYKDDNRSNIYKFLIFSKDGQVEDANHEHKGNKELDQKDIVIVKGQCIDLALIPLRGEVMSDVLLDTTPGDAIKWAMGRLLSKIVVGGKPIKYKIVMDKPDNDRKYEHIVVPVNTTIGKLPIEFQKNDYGVYNGGINVFVEKDRDGVYCVYIFPIIGYKFYDTVNKRSKLMIYSSANLSIDKTDKTYYKPEGSETTRLVVSGINILNSGQNDIIELGDTLLIRDPYKIVKKEGLDVTADGSTFDGGVITTSDTLRINKTNFSKQIDVGMDDNLFKHRSRLLQSNVSLVEVSLSKPDARIFKPGMKLLLVVKKKKSVLRLRGSLQALELSYNIVKKTIVGKLILAVEKDRDNG